MVCAPFFRWFCQQMGSCNNVHTDFQVQNHVAQLWHSFSIEKAATNLAHEKLLIAAAYIWTLSCKLTGGPAFEVELGCPVIDALQGRAFDFLLKPFIDVQDRCEPDRISSSRRMRNCSRVSPSDVRLIFFSMDSCACSGVSRRTWSGSRR
jgi:hypothetical protein